MMKRLLILAFLILTLCASAQATIITISGFSPGMAWRYGGTTAQLRISNSQGFLDSDGTWIPASTSTNFYKTITCDIASSTITCPSFTLSSTTNGNPTSSRYKFQFYGPGTANTPRDVLFSNFQVPIVLGTTITIAQLVTFNSATPTPPRPGFPDLQQVQTLINAVLPAPKATTTLEGIGRVSVTPVDPVHPIFVSDNDSRNTNTRTPTDNTVSTAKIQNLAVTAGKIANNTITATQIANSTITATQIAASLKPSGTATTSTESLRALGTTASTAAPGNIESFSSVSPSTLVMDIWAAYLTPVASGTAITTLVDNTALNTCTQATSGMRALYTISSAPSGRPSLTADGVDDNYNCGHTLDSTFIGAGKAWTFIYAFQSTAGTTQTVGGKFDYTFTGGDPESGTGRSVRHSIAIASALDAGVFGGYGANLFPLLVTDKSLGTTSEATVAPRDVHSVPVVVTYRWDPAAATDAEKSKIYVNGVLQPQLCQHCGGTGEADNVTSPFRLLADYYGDNAPSTPYNPFKGKFFGVTGWSSALSDTDRIKAEGIAAEMAGIQIGDDTGGWAAWTPTWTNVTVGNGTVQATYTQTGKTVHGRLSLVFGSTTSVSGAITFSLPVVSADRQGVGLSSIGQVLAYDLSADTVYTGVVDDYLLTKAICRAHKSDGTYTIGQACTATIPFTWATGDELTVTFSYPAK